MSAAIIIEGLVKGYDEHVVLNGISLTIEEGETFALLGTNGAGKTTTLECIEGVRKYESGSITVNGDIGVQLQSSSLPAHITVIEAFKLFSKWNKAHIQLELLRTFGLQGLKNEQYRNLSGGQKRRLHLALAVIGNPPIIILDEPTAGLDVEGRISLHHHIRNLKKLGKTIIIASHDMAEVESLCDRIAIIRNGEIAFVGTAQELTGRVGNQSIIYVKTLKSFKKQAFMNCSYVGTQQEYAVFKAASLSDALLEVLRIAEEAHNTVLDVRIERQSLEERFMEIARGGYTV